MGPIHLFGALVVCAIYVGGRFFERQAARYGIPATTVQPFITWILVSAFIGAHLVERLVYVPTETLKDPWSSLKSWQGISSFGGFVGDTIGGLLFFRMRLRKGTPWQIADSFAFGFPFGRVFGRLRCFVAFDHPGTPFGLYEALYPRNRVIVSPSSPSFS